MVRMGILAWLFGGGASEQDYIVYPEQEPWPKGWVWVESDVPVAGISKYQRAAVAFMRATRKTPT